MSQFYDWLGQRKSSRIRLAVMDMWKPFRLATNAHAPWAQHLDVADGIEAEDGRACDARCDLLEQLQPFSGQGIRTASSVMNSRLFN
jgi:hypothetical protein